MLGFLRHSLSVCITLRYFGGSLELVSMDGHGA